MASVTINMVFSDNGIIQKAQEAANKTQEALKREQAELNQLYNDLSDAMNSVGGGSTEPEEPEPTLPSDGTYSETKGVNTPDLADGQLTPIKWDTETNNWVETTGDDKEWYDYTVGEWANARTSDGSMWVWIPRYAYRITSGYHSSTTGTIEVEFLKGTSNEIGDSEAAKNITITNASGQGNWNVHPAFVGDANLGGGYGNNNGENDNGISGLWVAKFEASPVGATTDVANSQYDGTGKKLQVVPGVSSWRSITISNAYDVCKAYNSGLNSHLMKNSEWGAVAYLSRSEYGRDDEVWINNSSSYITGAAGNSVNASSNTGTNTDYTSTQGVKASTTNNVYGVYDMSGGAWEYVAGYVNNGNSNLTSYGSSLVNSTDAKTKNVYTKASTDNNANNYAANASKYGDAVYETSANGNTSNGSWYGDYSTFPYAGGPFFIRGGSCSGGSYAGVFCFSSSSGGAGSGNSFRPVLVAL